MGGVLRDGLSASSIPPQDEGEGVSRRAVLGAAVGLPLLPRHPELVSGSSSPPPERATSWTLKRVQGDDHGHDEAWREALAAFRAAEAEMRAVERTTAGGSAEEEEIWLPVYEARLDAFGGAVRGGLLAVAPDFGAFADKLELFFEHELEPYSVEDEVLAAIRADVRRLAGLA
jgi:hypothetical protein